MDITLFNTLGRKKQVFKPIIPQKAGMYTCGPTVYNYQHIGNFRTFLFEDFLKRVLMYNGYEVTHIMNITDVGHLVSDDDEGEDKMETGSEREGKTVWEIAEYYTQFFYDDAHALNIIEPTRYTKATEYIKEQIDMIKCLADKGFTYTTSDGVYFDTTKIEHYGKLAGLDIEGLEEGRRIQFSDEKKNKTDFALWKFSPKDKQRQMEWDSPWGKGFPGWHIECSAMSKKFLGDTFDIHCGGIDHIPIHHTNEIAQSEACNGKEFVHYWLHGAFLDDETGKMSKSKGDFLTFAVLKDKGYSALDYRYMCLGTHYRKRLIFNWDILESAKITLRRLRQNILRMKTEDKCAESWNSEQVEKEYKGHFLDSINDDLNMPEAIAYMWGVVKDERLDDKIKLELLFEFDKVLGLDLLNVKEEAAPEAPEEVMQLVQQRTEAKKSKNFKLADKLRAKVKDMGWEIVDKKEGAEVKKIKTEGAAEHRSDLEEEDFCKVYKSLDEINRKRADLFFVFYKQVDFQNALHEKKFYLGNKNNRTCRFCGRKKPDVKFKSEAHVIPQLLGNRNLLSYFECDDCNGKFSLYEDSLAAAFGPFRSIASIVGQSGIPKHKDPQTGMEIFKGEDEKTIINVSSDSGEVIYDDEKRKLIVKATKQSYVPLHVYKALVKQALCLLPESDLHDYRESFDLINSNVYDNQFQNGGIASAFVYFVPGPFLRTPSITMFKRNGLENGFVPEYTFVLTFQNHIMHFYIPFRKEDENMVVKKQIDLPVFPLLVDHNDMKQYGNYQLWPLNLSSSEKTKKEPTAFTLSVGNAIRLV